MTFRKLLLPTLIAALLVVPLAYAQTAGAGKDPAQHKSGARADSKAAGKADARQGDLQEEKDRAKAAKKNAKARAAADQPDEPEEGGR